MKKCFIVLLIALCVIGVMACKQEPAHEHKWDEGEITTPATCTADGVKTYKCTECEATKTEPVAATGHSWDDGTDNGNGKILHECTNCDENYSVYKTYAIGASGPATGFVIYDVDADNESGNADGLTSSECGWRYLEAAPADLGTYIFGYHRETDDGPKLFVNGTSTYSETNCTGTEIGTGKTNTEMLVKAMGSQAYISSTGPEKAAYAAKACADYVIGDFDDWFLPSKDELNLVYTNLRATSLSGFPTTFYWSSSEDPYTAYQALDQYFGDTTQYIQSGKQGNQTRYQEYGVRPIRSF